MLLVFAVTYRNYLLAGSLPLTTVRISTAEPQEANIHCASQAVLLLGIQTQPLANSGCVDDRPGIGPGLFSFQDSKTELLGRRGAPGLSKMLSAPTGSCLAVLRNICPYTLARASVCSSQARFLYGKAASVVCPLLLCVCSKLSCGCHRMSTDSVFSIAPASLNLGAVLSRGSPGITVYKAELMIGQCTLQVQHLKSCQHTFYTVSCNGF